MCGRKVITYEELIDVDTFLNQIDSGQLPSLLSPAITSDYARYNIIPSQPAPIAYRKKDGTITIELMHWGLHGWPFKEGSKDSSWRTFNARKDTLTSNKLWPKFFPKYRCVIPMKGFYEWTGPKGNRIPHYIKPTDGSYFMAAGLVSKFSPRDNMGSYTMITVEPNSFMNKIHNRMPALLHHSEVEDWLNPDHSSDYLLDILQPFPDDVMEEYIVSTDVNTTKVGDYVDAPYLIEPATLF